MRLLGEVVEGSGSNDFAYSGKDEGGKAGSSSSSSSSSSSTAEGEEEEAEGGEDIDVGGMEALAAEMAVESVLQGRAERAASLGDGDGEGDAEDDDDVQDVLGIDAVVVDDPEDGEWPDPLGALYISQHAKRADGGDASAEPDGNPKKKARVKVAPPRPPASGIVDLTHLKIPRERPRLPEAQRQALSLGAKWIGLELPDAQAVAEMQPGSRANDPELVDLSGGPSQQSERRVLGAAEHKAMREKSKVRQRPKRVLIPSLIFLTNFSSSSSSPSSQCSPLSGSPVSAAAHGLADGKGGQAQEEGPALSPRETTTVLLLTVFVALPTN